MEAIRNHCKTHAPHFLRLAQNLLQGRMCHVGPALRCAVGALATQAVDQPSGSAPTRARVFVGGGGGRGVQRGGAIRWPMCAIEVSIRGDSKGVGEGLVKRPRASSSSACSYVAIKELRKSLSSAPSLYVAACAHGAVEIAKRKSQAEMSTHPRTGATDNEGT